MPAQAGIRGLPRSKPLEAAPFLAYRAAGDVN